MHPPIIKHRPAKPYTAESNLRLSRWVPPEALTLPENGETYLCPIEDDEEFNEVGSAFEERLAEMFDFEEEE